MVDSTQLSHSRTTLSCLHSPQTSILPNPPLPVKTESSWLGCIVDATWLFWAIKRVDESIADACPGCTRSSHTIKHITEDRTVNNHACQQHTIHSMNALWENLIQAMANLKNLGLFSLAAWGTTPPQWEPHIAVVTHQLDITLWFAYSCGQNWAWLPSWRWWSPLDAFDIVVVSLILVCLGIINISYFLGFVKNNMDLSFLICARLWLDHQPWTWNCKIETLKCKTHYRNVIDK